MLYSYFVYAFYTCAPSIIYSTLFTISGRKKQEIHMHTHAHTHTYTHAHTEHFTINNTILHKYA